MIRSLLALLPCALAALSAQVPVGHAVVLTDGAAAPTSLWLYEPLSAGFTPLIATALPAMRLSQVHMLGRGQRLLLAGTPQGGSDDVLLMCSVQGNMLVNPVPFAQGIRGHALAILPTASEFVIVTAQAVFSTPLTGGPATLLTSAALAMNNRDAALLDADTLATSTADQAGQATLWLLELTTRQLRNVPMRLTAPVAIGEGPSPGTLLVGDSSGNLMAFDPLTLTRAPWTNIAAPAQRLLGYSEPRGWLAVFGASLLPVRGQQAGLTAASPAGPVLDADYRPYESTITTYGTACAGSTATPAIGWQGRPVPGLPGFSLTLGSARANSIAALMLGTGATDIPLDSFGMPSCRLLTQPVVSLTLTTSSTGQSVVPFAIPPQAFLVGAQLFAQWLVIDPQVNPASLVTSNAARIDI